MFHYNQSHSNHIETHLYNPVSCFYATRTPASAGLSQPAISIPWHSYPFSSFIHIPLILVKLCSGSTFILSASLTTPVPSWSCHPLTSYSIYYLPFIWHLVIYLLSCFLKKKEYFCLIPPTRDSNLLLNVKKKKSPLLAHNMYSNYICGNIPALENIAFALFTFHLYYIFK